MRNTEHPHESRDRQEAGDETGLRAMPSSRDWLVPFLLRCVRDRAVRGRELRAKVGDMGLDEAPPEEMYAALLRLKRERRISCEPDGNGDGFGDSSGSVLPRRRYGLTEAGAVYLGAWADSLARHREDIHRFLGLYDGRMPGYRAGARGWLIAKNGGGPAAALPVGHGDKEALAVFRFAEEAEMFLRFGKVDGDWRAWERGAGELVSVLFGPCKDVGRVALDPIPEMLAETAELTGLSRESFLERIIGRRLLPAS